MSFDVKGITKNWKRNVSVLALSVFLLSIGQHLYALWFTNLPFPKDYCKAYTTQLNDDDPIYCAQYKSKLIHATIDHDEYLARQENHTFKRILIVAIMFATGLLINYFLFYRRNHKDGGTIYSKRKLFSDTINASIFLPFLMILISESLFPERAYDILVVKPVKELRDERVKEEMEYAKWLLETEPENYENDPD